MRTFHALVVLFALTVFAFAPQMLAQGELHQDQAILAVMDKQVTDWNRGDLEAFASTYKNSPDILFLGTNIYRGYAAMLGRYREAFATREKMGTLSFSQLEVQSLDERFATVTGHYHLERTSAGGGNSDGYFLLVFEKTKDGWKIVRDDTTTLPKSAK